MWSCGKKLAALYALCFLFSYSHNLEASLKCRDRIFQAAAIAQSLHPLLRGTASLVYGVCNTVGGKSQACPPLQYLIALGLFECSFENKVVAEVKDGRSMFMDSLNLCYSSSSITEGLLIDPSHLGAIPLGDETVDLIISIKRIDLKDNHLRELIRVTKASGEIRFTVSTTQVSRAEIDRSKEFLTSLPEVHSVSVVQPLNPFHGRLITIRLGDK